ncbi:MAG: peptidoglycan editing factor PgeF [Coxiellaceae bacterium]|nr:peptidoglycan editing factor PgeF [Coxiellaceae bacterium]
MLIKGNNITAYFGSKSDDLQRNGIYENSHFKKLSEKIAVDRLFFLKQTHSKSVFYLDKMPKKSMTLFEIEGDAIITQQKNIGIGVVTADCVPLFIVDTKNDAIAAIHAGWKGLSLNIITETVDKMQLNFGTDLHDLKVFIGPSADVCCYEVKPDFLEYFDDTLVDTKIVESRDGKIYFHPKKAALIELQKTGFSLSQIDDSNHRCTICHNDFCSVRREKNKAGRQPSVIYLSVA